MTTSTSGILSAAPVRHVLVMIKDFTKMFSFYRDTLGLEVDHSDNGHCAFFKTDNQHPGIALHSGRKSIQEEQAVIVIFEVEGIEAVADALKSKGVKVGKIYEEPPYGKLVQFWDPEGNCLELLEPPKP